MCGFNLIVSTFRFREDEAHKEIMALLGRFGDPGAWAEISVVKGIILVKTALDPFTVIEKLKETIDSEPWEVRYILRVIPIEVVVPSKLEDIQGAANDLAARIGQEESFRITVEKRHSPLHSHEIIDYIAEVVPRKVELDNPDWTILVEIVGKDAGISAIRYDQVFSAVVEKRDSGD